MSNTLILMRSREKRNNNDSKDIKVYVLLDITSENNDGITS